MKIAYYIPLCLMVGTMIALTLDITTKIGVLQVTGDIWKGAFYTWWVYLSGVLTHYFYVRAKKNAKEYSANIPGEPRQ